MNTEMIPVEECVERHVYRIRSRNLRVGVFRRGVEGAESFKGMDGFLGLRDKFKDTYVFEEYHRTTGGAYGTVAPQEDTGFVLPDEIPLLENLPGSWDMKTGKEVIFIKSVADCWCWKETGEPDQDIRACVKANTTLFAFLMKTEKGMGLR